MSVRDSTAFFLRLFVAELLFLLGAFAFILTSWPWRSIPCWIKKIPSLESRLRYCHYDQAELERMISDLKYKEGEILKEIRSQEEIFGRRMWELSEAARTRREETAISEPLELTQLRHSLLQVQELLTAVEETHHWVQNIAALRMPLRICGILLAIAGAAMSVAIILSRRDHKKVKT